MKLPCMDCGELREVDQRTVELVGQMQGLLKRMGERGLADHEIVRCDPCWRTWRDRRSEESSRQFFRAQEILAQLARSVRAKPSVLEGLRCGQPASMRALFARGGIEATDVLGWETGDVTDMYMRFLDDWIRARDAAEEKRSVRRRQPEVPA